MIVKKCILQNNNLDLIVDINEEEQTLLNIRYKWKIAKDPTTSFIKGENHIKGLFVEKYFEKIDNIIKTASSHISIIKLMDYVVRI